MDIHYMFWIAFAVIISVMFYIDLYVTEHRTGKVSLKSSLIWSGIWISCALVFNAAIFYFFGKNQGMEFFAGYLIEKSLSVDNLFVFLMIFSIMKVESQNQPHADQLQDG